MIELIHKYSQYFTAIIAAIGGVFLLFSKGKKIIIKKYKERKEYLQKRNSVPIILENIHNKLEVVDKRLIEVEKEVKPNGGGSMKDVLKIVQAEIEAAFWLNPSPSFRTTSSGVNILVNEAYCHLCGVSSEDLLKLGWKNYVYNDDDDSLDYYMEQWRESAKAFSQFSGKLHFKNYKDEPRGEWTAKIRPLGSTRVDGKEEFLWHGILYPSDPIAILYAVKNNIPTQCPFFSKNGLECEHPLNQN